MYVFKTSLELRVNGIILVMRMSFGSYKDVKIKGSYIRVCWS